MIGRAPAPLLLLVVAAGCGVDERVGHRREPLVAYCEAMVTGTGVVDVETDYLPHVVNCENGGAAFEALAAQAVAARSYLYYKLDRSGSIGDGTGDQVYSCGREPSAEHYRAVEETSGIVLQYAGVQVAAFYVAGARQEPPDCRGGTDDPTNTERYVTYNEGLSGDGITQTTLGWVSPTNYANRGCLSQNGSHCLAGAGWGRDDILRFYYGEDIEIVHAEGDCVVATDPDAGTLADAAADDAGGAADASDGADGSAGDASPPDDGPVTARTGGRLSGGCAVAVRPSPEAGPLPAGVLLIALLARHRRRDGA